MKLPDLKLLVLQDVVGGPWQWCIIDDKNRVVAKSPDKFQRRGWAFKNLLAFVRLFSAGPPKIQFCPAIQLSLFKDEKVEA